MMLVIDIVKAHLTAEGFGGLVSEYGECGCALGDLAPCSFDFSQCEPGYVHINPSDPDAWAIWRQKEPPTDEQWEGMEL